MANLDGFNAGNVEPRVGFAPIQPGKYTANITDSLMRATRAGTGEYLELKFQIADGNECGRFVWTRLNLKHPNPAVVRAARAELSAICHAVAVLTPHDSSELHFIPLIIEIGHKKRSEGDEIDNVITAYARCEPSADESEIPI